MSLGAYTVYQHFWTLHFLYVCFSCTSSLSMNFNESFKMIGHFLINSWTTSWPEWRTTLSRAAHSGPIHPCSAIRWSIFRTSRKNEIMIGRWELVIGMSNIVVWYPKLRDLSLKDESVEIFISPEIPKTASLVTSWKKKFFKLLFHASLKVKD